MLQACANGAWQDMVCVDDQICQNGRCVEQRLPPECQVDETRCNENTRQRCVDGRWQNNPCVVGMMCQNGGCVRQAQCQDEATRCSPLDPEQLQFCQDGQWIDRGCRGDQVCQAGECVSACPMGSLRCLGDTLQGCRDGMEWMVLEECGSGCDVPRGGEAQCRCRLGEAECIDSPGVRDQQIARNCGVTGFWEAQACGLRGRCMVDERNGASCR